VQGQTFSPNRAGQKRHAEEFAAQAARVWNHSVELKVLFVLPQK
jgi:hypothetical protein